MHHTEATINETSSTTFATENVSTYRNPWRISAMDLQRGIIMILMALSHSREFIGIEHYTNDQYNVSPSWLGSNFLDFFQQVFVEILVAGGFYMMMGIGIVYLFQARLKAEWSLEKTCSYLIQRGLVLVVIQFTILQFFEIIGLSKVYFYVGVLFGLGVDMIFASLCLYFIYKLKAYFAIKNASLEFLLPLALILIITLSIQALMTSLHDNHQQPTYWMTLLVMGGQYMNMFGYETDIDFTPIPWFPAVAFGLMIGQILFLYREKSFKYILGIGFSCLVSFFLIRTANLYGWFNFGDFKYLAPGDIVTPAAYFSVSKYPPSITYFLWAFGINLLGICLWQIAEKYTPSIIKLMNPVKIIGQCALFFFVLHWFLYYGISLLLPYKLSNSTGIVALWLLGIIPLYLMCKQYNAFKSRQPQTSKWRML